MEIIAGFILLATFLVAVAARRAYFRIALVVGSLPALLVAFSSPSSLANPLVLLYLFAIWLPFVIAAAVGTLLARLVHARWRRA